MACTTVVGSGSIRRAFPLFSTRGRTHDGTDACTEQSTEDRQESRLQCLTGAVAGAIVIREVQPEAEQCSSNSAKS